MTEGPRSFSATQALAVRHRSHVSAADRIVPARGQELATDAL